MSLSVENKHLTASLEGMAVLNLRNKSTNTCSPNKAAASSLQSGLDLWFLELLVIPAAPFCLSDTTEEVIYILFTVAAHVVRLRPNGFLDLTLHTFPPLGKSGEIRPIQPDEVKHRMWSSSSQLASIILQVGPKPFVDACQNGIDQGVTVEDALGLQVLSL